MNTDLVPDSGSPSHFCILWGLTPAKPLDPAKPLKAAPL